VDVTEQRAAEEALRTSEERYRQLALEREASELRYRTLFERNLAGVYQSTPEGGMLDCNEAFARILGFPSRESALQADAHSFYRSREERASIVERARAQGFLHNYEIEMIRQDGSPVWVLENKSWVTGAAGQPDTMLGTLVDITDMKRAEEELQRLAYHDPLTALPNRWLFDDRLEVALRQARYQRQPVAVVFLDLDRFKLVNDSLGHRMGDVLLRSVSERLVSCVFEGDTVARLGGDEFLILLPRIAAADDVIRVVHKIQEALRRPFRLDGREVFVTASMGATIFPLDGEDADALVKNADTAMYRAKQNGRDGYQLYAPEMNARAVERIHLESELHRALEREELVLHYQPLVELSTGRVYGAEALMRWRHPSRGLVPPADFIPLAEESGLITPIGAWALRAACLQALAWWKSGRSLRVAVNLSARQFRDVGLVQRVADILTETGLPPQNLQLEITESLAMSDAEDTISTLRALSGLGVDVLLDDFGTGFSSLAYLKRFPIAGLKIDRSFIQDVTSSRRDLAISKAAVDVAEGLGLRTVAEGVETREQVAVLRALGCRAIQGYVVSAAVPAERFEAFLAGPVL
jgi:diguanylate cyclase (GGDEF)-like protein/PAS domain S-box-containing protein